MIILILVVNEAKAFNQFEKELNNTFINSNSIN